MIRVLIERRIAEGLEHYYDSSIKRIVSAVTEAPGCISGESLIDIDKPNRRIIMSKWSSPEHWNDWFHSDKRHQIIAEITPALEEKEQVTILALSK